jgi:hypothetical protein
MSSWPAMRSRRSVSASGCSRLRPGARKGSEVDLAVGAMRRRKAVLR